MNEYSLTPGMLELVARRFKLLAEPARLNILYALREKEMTVSELMAATGLEQANTSNHLQRLHDQGFVERRKEGLFVFYRLAGREVLELCEMMCTRLENEAEADSSRG